MMITLGREAGSALAAAAAAHEENMKILLSNTASQ
jgi:hypothetical protein